ncbi:MAG: substrate-binding domain-containing protein [Syntrophorhabdaceae bacterium]
MPLNIFGPGGPYTPMMECALAYMTGTGIELSVIMGTPERWMNLARHAADLIYGGAEYMMTDFMEAYPDMIDVESITHLYAREVGIIVRPGNPAGVHSLPDLGQKKMSILNVELEKMESLHDISGITVDNIARTVLTGKEGFDLWPVKDDVNAWVTYRSWHVKLGASSDFIRLPETERTYRKTLIAITNRSKARREAAQFINFLLSQAGHGIFQKWGWE